MNREKLQELRDYIATIDSNILNMKQFLSIDGYSVSLMSVNIKNYQQPEERPCGTVGCVIGWGILNAGLNPEALSPNDFSSNVLGIPVYNRLWDFLFEYYWGYPENIRVDQHTDALERMDYVLSLEDANPEDNNFWVNEMRSWANEIREENGVIV